MHGILTPAEQRMNLATRDQLGIVKYQNIYKNFLREIKKFFLSRFDEFKKQFENRFIEPFGLRLNQEMIESLFVLQILLFVLNIFDQTQITNYFSKACVLEPWESGLSLMFSRRFHDKEHFNQMSFIHKYLNGLRDKSQQEMIVKFRIALAFKMGSFIQPKQLIRAFSLKAELISVSLQHNLDLILSLCL